MAHTLSMQPKRGTFKYTLNGLSFLLIKDDTFNSQNRRREEETQRPIPLKLNLKKHLILIDTACCSLALPTLIYDTWAVVDSS